MIQAIRRRLKLFITNKKWRKANPHNTTSMKNIYDISRVTVGKGTYGRLNISMYDETTKVRIGNFCSIADAVSFLAAADHIQTNISTFPFKTKYCGYTHEAVSSGDIIVEDDVWIGHGASILSNVHIGQGAIVAAGAVVTKDIPPYAVVGGVPAKVIKYRFPNDIIEKLMQCDFGKMTDEIIQRNLETCYTSVTRENIDSIISKLQLR